MGDRIEQEFLDVDDVADVEARMSAASSGLAR